MSTKNIFQQRIRPVLPRILQEERVFVYVPKASESSAGIAYFPDEEFTIGADGRVTLKWPMSMQVENTTINNPLYTLARVKVSEEEFVNTNEQVIVTHPTTKKSYSNTKSAIKLKRTGQNLFNKPGFIMVDGEDFEKEEIDSGDTQDPGRYAKYKLKHNNPLEKASLTKLNSQDFDYDNEAKIRWPLAHDPASGTNRTNEYGLVKIKSNSDGYLKFNEGYLELDVSKVKQSGKLATTVIPVYGGKDNGFEDYNSYVGEDGFAKYDAEHNLLLKLTKDAVGLNKVENKSFAEYTFSNFGPEMQEHFTKAFNDKVSVENWNKLFIDWSEPTGNTVQKIVTELRAEDESIRDAMRTNRSFLGFFEDVMDLENTYAPGEWTLGSTAFIRDTGSYWKVRPNNVNKIVENRVPVKSDIPTELVKEAIDYKIGRRDTQQIYQWNGTNFVLTTDTLKWVDVVLANEEDIQPYIQSHASEHFIEGFRIGCRETNVIIKYVNNSWVEDGTMYYEWANTYITTLLWNSFVETDSSTLKPNGVANVGTSGKWVSSDHVHPTDTTRLAKDVFNATTINIQSIFNNNDDNDFKVAFTNGGYKSLNIPYVRTTKSIHNWNGNTTFVDSEEAEEYYWSGTQDEFIAQADNIQNKSLVIIDDEEQYVPQDLVQVADLDKAGITIGNNSLDRFIVIKADNIDSLVGVPLTIEKVTTESGEERVYLKQAISEMSRMINDNKLLVTKIVDNKQTITTYSSNSTKQTLLGFASDGELIELPEDRYVNIANPLYNGRLVVSNTVGRNVKSLTAIDLVEGGIIVADGNGAIKSTSFTKAGKLLQTAGEAGEKLAAEIDVNTLVTSTPTEFTDNGIVVSNSVGGIKRQSLGVIPNQLIVSDGEQGLKVQTIENESLVYIDNTGRVMAFPTTPNDAGKVVTVQSNGKIGIQSLPTAATHLPVTTLGCDTICGTKLSFGETSVFEEGVLYLW